MVHDVKDADSKREYIRGRDISIKTDRRQMVPSCVLRDESSYTISNAAKLNWSSILTTPALPWLPG